MTSYQDAFTPYNDVENRLKELLLDPQIHRAHEYATKAHEGQIRKRKRIPYIRHPERVAVIVALYGGDENQIIAALLHDVVEDSGGLRRLHDIRQQFGDDVATLVAECSDNLGPLKDNATWWQRKEAYLKKMNEESPRGGLVSLADKYSNCLDIIDDYQNDGEGIWDMFSSGSVGQLWYYDSLARVLPRRVQPLGPLPQLLATKFKETVFQLHTSVSDHVGRFVYQQRINEGRRFVDSPEIGLI